MKIYRMKAAQGQDFPYQISCGIAEYMPDRMQRTPVIIPRGPQPDGGTPRRIKEYDDLGDRSKRMIERMRRVDPNGSRRYVQRPGE